MTASSARLISTAAACRLVEMVTEPDLRTADEAAQYLIRLRQLAALAWDFGRGHGKRQSAL